MFLYPSQPRAIAAPVRAALTLALAATLVSGCMANRTRTVTPLQPAPSQPVVTAALAPPLQPEIPEAPISDAALPEGTGAAPGGQTAAAAPNEPLAVGRTDLLGGWSITSGGDDCQLFMSLTNWTGGYRASTRGCNGPVLSGISAWDLSGSTVTLKSGDAGTTVATLQATDSQRFSGSTTDGAPITVAR